MITLKNLLNISYSTEEENIIWLKVELNLIQELSSWEVKANSTNEDDVFKNILEIIPIIMSFDELECLKNTQTKIDINKWIALNSQINQFVYRNQFRNVDKSDWLAKSVKAENLTNLGLQPTKD